MAAPPELMDELVGEILLRLPPDEPADLVRAALVCKPWLRVLTDPAFLRHYRAFHRTPPLLGFLHNLYDSGPIPRFVPTTAASPCSSPAFDCDSWWALDCRHGRVLIHTFGPMGLVVWDPITGGQQRAPLPTYPHGYCTGAVLCAVAGCDHLDCRNGRFLVVFVGTDDPEGGTWASVYSSETGEWSASTTVDLSASDNVDFHTYVEMRPAHLIGNALYFMLELGKSILKYDLGEGGLSVIDAPLVEEMGLITTGGFVMTAEDGGLELAAVEEDSLYIWSWQEGDEGNAAWMLRRVIDLKTLHPIQNLLVSPEVIGHAEGTYTIFLSTDAGIFTFDLKSGKVRKVGEREAYYTVLPYMSFCAPEFMLWDDCRRLEDTEIDPLTQVL
ncbi:hypothetical protein ACP70R_014578 [Stipagrostis hirtigluma subsp. patula]